MNKKYKKFKLHIKIGDTVKILTGSCKGQTGEVIKTFADKNTVLVKDINMKTKHKRPTQEGETGQIIRQEAAIHSSNVMLYDKETKIASRYKKEKDSSGKYKRILIKSGNNK
uniref:Large ribosomal subunit protein uL24c n=1 Tax=Helminthocladia australis TaxID=260093 RepID=A0A1G4NTM9_9FLOR|nr:Ribosomal protein L24 [Helminthocladia australis]SCW22010.1 Ribosomal protein L24 [Helminthocladia australis]